MSIYYECAQHGLAVESLPAYSTAEPLDHLIDEHERLHAADEAEQQRRAGKWSITRQKDGWWVAKRGDTEAACLTWEQAKRHVALATLVELAGDEWVIGTGVERVTLRQHGDPLTKQFPGTTCFTQAIAFLRGVHADRARRAELAAARDRVNAELDVITDQFNRDAAALAKALTA